MKRLPLIALGAVLVLAMSAFLLIRSSNEGTANTDTGSQQTPAAVASSDKPVASAEEPKATGLEVAQSDSDTSADASAEAEAPKNDDSEEKPMTEETAAAHLNTLFRKTLEP